MKKKLYQSGNAWVLLIQKAILQLLEINPEEDEVELEVENKVLKVKKKYRLDNYSLIVNNIIVGRCS